jgi:hypothetical protein
MWPSLRYADWSDTCETLQMWTQIVGKIRMEKAPPMNHWWHVVLYVTSRGLGTSPIPDGDRTFDIDFDFVDHALRIACSDGTRRDFYRRIRAALSELEIDVHINTMPSEVQDPVRFEEDVRHAAYDAKSVERFWRVLVAVCQIFTEFRSRFIGRVSPVHLFWGGLDLAVTRFSGRRAPDHPPVPGLPDRVVREGYSHEVCSAGFWPGGFGFDAAFYSYAYPESAGYAQAAVRPGAAFYSNDLREFLLPYEAMRSATSPARALMEFLQSTYVAAADLGHWPREELERPPRS